MTETYDKPMAMVDIVLLTLKDDRLHVVLLERENDPMKGKPALIGGFIHMDEDEDLDAAVSRILRQKAGLRNVYAEQLSTFGSRTRDKRGWSVSVAYLALLPLARIEALKHRGLRVVDASLLPDDIPFDHPRIIEAAISRMRTKGIYSILPALLLPPSFTLTEMQQAYEITTGKDYDLANFRRKIIGANAVEETGEMSKGGSKRPAVMYRLKPDALLLDRVL